MFELIGFYIFAVLVIAFFIIAISSKNILYSISSLACGMVLLSAHYFLLDAEFIGAAQIIVYSGAVLGLYSFAMMFFDLNKELNEKLKHKKSFFTLSILSILMLIFMLCMPKISNKTASVPIDNDFNNTQNIGVVLFTKYLLAFELIALVMLIVLVCAIALVAKKIKEEQ